jgi:hypothetical protein
LDSNQYLSQGVSQIFRLYLWQDPVNYSNLIKLI